MFAGNGVGCLGPMVGSWGSWSQAKRRGVLFHKTASQLPCSCRNWCGGGGSEGGHGKGGQDKGEQEDILQGESIGGGSLHQMWFLWRGSCKTLVSALERLLRVFHSGACCLLQGPTDLALYKDHQGVLLSAQKQPEPSWDPCSPHVPPSLPFVHTGASPAGRAHCVTSV